MTTLPLIVGLGASAGGLEAFRGFLSHVPADTGMAFVLVQHLSPDHGSLLTELLQKATDMMVTEAEDGVQVAADRVYIITPNTTLTIEDGRLRVEKPAPARKFRRPIDSFFQSLAEDQGENAVCIVLSGVGTDGTLGLTAIKEHGGLTLAQAETDHMPLPGMPGSAAETGLVDHVVPVEEMPAKLADYRTVLEKADGAKGPDGTRKDARDHLASICGLLRNRTAHDFGQYKEKTLTRRVQRRMQVLQIHEMPDYVERLREEPGEIDLLFRDLLIGVTQFFRDMQSFEALRETVLPEMLDGRQADDPVRIWVPGCATGEEAYSLAILLKEAIVERELSVEVQIFATDIDERAIAAARAGRYPATTPGLSPETAQRWFIEDGDHINIAQSIREMCVFSLHSLIKDPPFSKLDLVSCRNLLIYMEPDLQSRVVQTLHYGLKRTGFLFLGPSETITRQAALFSTLDKKHHIFRRRSDTGAVLPQLNPGRNVTTNGRKNPPELAVDHVDRTARRAMEQHFPAYVVIDEHQQILRFSGETGRYLQPSPGVPNFNLFNMLRKTLRPAAQGAVQQAISGGQRVVHESLLVEIEGGRKLVNLMVEPIRNAGDDGRNLYIVAFQDAGPFGADKVPRTSNAAGVASNDLEDLEKELAATRAQLQTAIDDLEGSNEELKSANEEYQSVNEELQSSNEELETAKEEQQSINEELQTLNTELNDSNDTLARANSDLQNLLDSTQIATLFLSADLKVRNFTPAVTDIFHLRETDRGRPLTEVVTRLNYDDFKRDVDSVLRTLSVIEQEVHLREGEATFLMRIRPYRTVDNVIDGAVLTFIDITERNRHEIERSRLAAIVDSSNDAIIGHAFDGTITSWNPGAQRIFGYDADEAVGEPLTLLLGSGQSDDVPAIVARLKRGERIDQFEIERTRKNGEPISVALTISPVFGSRGDVVAVSTIARDVTEEKAAAAQQSLLIGELDHRVKNMLALVSSLASQTLRTSRSPGEFVDTFQGRLQALGNVQALLTQSTWTSVSLGEIVRATLSPYRENENESISAKGDDVVLTPKATLTLSLAIHELATNASKYGALSVEAGKVDISWAVSGPKDGRLTLRWTETGGPDVEAPEHEGFGSKLIAQSLSYEMKGTFKREFLTQGVRCTLAFPLTEKTGRLRATEDGS